MRGNHFKVANVRHLVAQLYGASPSFRKRRKPRPPRDISLTLAEKRGNLLISLFRRNHFFDKFRLKKRVILKPLDVRRCRHRLRGHIIGLDDIARQILNAGCLRRLNAPMPVDNLIRAIGELAHKYALDNPLLLHTCDKPLKFRIILLCRMMRIPRRAAQVSNCNIHDFFLSFFSCPKLSFLL